MSPSEIDPKAVPRITFALLGFLLAALALLLSAAHVSAAVVTDRPLLFTFDGSDSTAGRFQGQTANYFQDGPRSIAVDNATGAVYVASKAHDVESVCKFDPDGSAANFSATGDSCLTGPPGSSFQSELRVAVDNSGGPNQGRLYVSQLVGKKMHAFAPDGTSLWSLSLPEAPGDVAVDPSGHPWVIDYSGRGNETGGTTHEVREYASSGTPPAEIGSFDLGAEGESPIDFDKSGNCYIQQPPPGDAIRRFAACDLKAPLQVPTVLDPSAEDVYADQSSPTGHIFTVAKGDFQEYDSGGALLGSFGADYLNGGEEVSRIAYNPAKDWVYETRRAEPAPAVAVFGPKASGTVPDATVDPPGEVKVSCAHFSGTINPQGVSSSWHFEWRRPKPPLGSQSWAAGGSSPAQSLPVDSSDHEVQYDTCALSGKTTFEVRLVGVNSENQLRGFSSAEEFATETPALPSASLDPISAITTGSAHLSGSIDPEEDTVPWQVETTTVEGCASGWTRANPPPDPVTFDGTLGSQAVAYELKGLLAAEHYCVRIEATNGGGSVTSNVEEFETEEIPPSEAETSFVAPRLDISAYLNAKVNPQGAPVAFHFEYSSDDGATWKSTPDRTDDVEAREQVYVAQQLTGLSPATTYRYRLASAENDAGSTAVSGEGTFTTRSSAELAPPEPCPNADVRAKQHTAYLGNCRGVELVNNPDKGNQNVVASVGAALFSPNATTADGEKALWKVTSGAPGANTAVGDTFLAQRSASGWSSETLIPPAAKQLGGGGFGYELSNATPDFSRFAFRTSRTGIFIRREGAWVRLGTGEEVLKAYPQMPEATAGEISDDGAHVLAPDPATGQLEDIGSGTPEALSLTPSGGEFSCESSFAEIKSPAGEQRRLGYRRMATDASRAYFEVQPNGQCKKGLYGLYQRNRKGKGKTTLIDPGASGQSPEIIRVTPDGHAVYFLTASKLDGADENSGRDVYRWDEATGSSTCLTCEATADAEIRPNSNVLVSDDFSHVYFESESQLVPGQGRAGTGNVYALSGGEIRFVADPDTPAIHGGISGVLHSGFSSLSADGNVLVFSSFQAHTPSRRLSADDVAAECPRLLEAGKLGQCVELYRYDDRNGSVECISCRHDGFTTHSWGSLKRGGQQGLYAGFGLSSDGNTVAFPTSQALVPGDVNDDTDIYEWRNGATHLVTDGTSDFLEGFGAPVVTGIDADGENILFALTDPGLTGYERDGLSNLYDARIGGGFPPPPAPSHCAEDSCQGPLAGTPGADQPASVAFEGRGNAAQGAARPRCAKSRVRRHGRCVKARKTKHHKRAANAKQGGSK